MAQMTTTYQTGFGDQTNRADGKSPELIDLLGKVEKFLEVDQPEAALEVIRSTKLNSPWLTNAIGVCQLRLGNTDAAVDMFRGLVLAAGGLILRRDVPIVFEINFATALLADGNLSGGLRTLAEIGDEEHSAVREIRDAVRRWEADMTRWEKFRWFLGGSPPRPLVLDCPLGRL